MKKITVLFAALLLTAACYSQRNPCNPEGKPYAQLPGDTTITLPSGTTLTFNRCEFFDLRDCMEITEITDTAGLRRAGMNMYDNRGNLLLTAGMFSISLKDCGKTCFDIPVKVRMRIRLQPCADGSTAIPNLYIGNAGTWEKPADIKSTIAGENDERYMEFTLPCAGVVNCDIPQRGRKVKFIAPEGYKIERLRIGRNCPLFYADDNFIKPKRKHKVRLLCVGTAATELQAVMTDTRGQQIRTPYIKLTTLKNGGKLVNCTEPKRSFFSRIFSWRKKSGGDLDKKYYLPG